MAQLNYEFNRKPLNPKRSPDRWSRQLRLTLLFLAVAAITAAAIYALVPGKKVEPVRKTTEPLSQKNSPDEKNTVAEKIFTDAEKKTVSEKDSKEDTGKITALPEIKPDTVPTPAEKSNDNMSSLSDRKGEVSAGDLPQEKDKAELTGSVSADAEKNLKELLSQGDLSGAAEIVGATASGSADRAVLGKLFTDKQREIFFRRNTAFRSKSVTHRVVSGDNLSVLAKRYHTTLQMIRRKNKLKSSNIMIGQKLEIIPGPWRIEITKKSRLLTLFRTVDGKEQIFAVFEVGIGRKNSTPAGKFVISHRRFHPVYRDKHGRVFDYGSKGNQLGEAFLALALPKAPDKPFRGYGLHGTGDEDSVGRSLSNGCVRMHNDDILMLYYLVPSGTTVNIAE